MTWWQMCIVGLIVVALVFAVTTLKWLRDNPGPLPLDYRRHEMNWHPRTFQTTGQFAPTGWPEVIRAPRRPLLVSR